MWNLKVWYTDFYHIFYFFFLFGIAGWIYESSYVSIRNKKWINRGFLSGPIIPIYGVGATVVYMAFENYKGRYLLIFFGGIILASILEYVTSFLMEILFHAKWWDYSNVKYNIKGRICLSASIFWGILSVVLTEILGPLALNLIAFIKRPIGEYIGYIMVIIFLWDITVTVIQTIKLDKIFNEVHRTRVAVLEYIENSKLYEIKEGIKIKRGNYNLHDLMEKALLLIDKNKVKHNNDYITYYKDKVLIEHISKVKRKVSQLNWVQKRLLRSFPNMVRIKQKYAVKDLHDELTNNTNNERWLSMSSILDGEIKGSSKKFISGTLRVTLVAILVLLQISFMFLLTYWLSDNTLYYYLFIEFASILIIIGLVNDNRSSSFKIAWICIVLVLPVTGHIMYILWGKADSKRKIEKKVLAKLNHGAQYYHYDKELSKEFAMEHPTQSRISTFMENQKFPLFKNNEVNYYPMGQDVFKAIFEDLRNAKKFILINFFIVAEGALWDKIHEILLEKISQGVMVKFMYDDFGATLRTSKYFKKRLEEEGIEVGVFNPIHKYTEKLYMNHRSHQKIIVIDGNIGYTGGMNLADEYVNIINRFGVWKDNAVRVEGEAVWGLTVTFLQMWEICMDNGHFDYNPYRPTKKFKENDVYCHVIADGPANNPRNPIESIYKQMIYYATDYLYITTPYLVIEDDMKEALITAAEGGIDVRIITPYIPDKKNVKLLTNYNYGRLLEAGVKIYEYKPGFIHAKTIITKDCGIIGTINMDYRSFYLHYECGLWMCDNDIIEVIKDDILKTIDECVEISYQEWKNRPWTMKVSQRILYLFATQM